MKEKIERIKREIIRSNMDNKYIDELNEVEKYIEDLEKKIKEKPEMALEESAEAMEAIIPYTVYIAHANIQIGMEEKPPLLKND